MSEERMEAARKLGFRDFRNATRHRFEDISNEKYREYVFSDHVVKIENPIALNENFNSGTHRVFDAYGVSHYINSGWKEIKWEADEDEPHFTR